MRRLEYGHADSGVAYARACLERFPDTPTAYEPIAGGWAIFQGAESPQTQALAVGMNGPVSGEEFARLVQFYQSRGSVAVIDLATIADASVLNLLQSHQVTIREVSNVLARFVRSDENFLISPEAAVEESPTGDSQEWGRLVLRAFLGQENPSQQQLDLISATPPNFKSYFASWNGQRVAAAAMGIWQNLATFFGDATLPPARSSGLQLALIRHRLREAANMGCDLASASVIPGGSSHRNYERAGFHLVYSRVQIAIAE